MSLPVEAALPEIIALLRRRNVVLIAPPGAGKTTLIPPALLAAALCDHGEAWILQPRRLAARLAAERVAELLGEPVGRRCGYQVRFESAVSAATRIRFVTEGLLTRRLREQPGLPGIDTVVLDEFHERHLDGDLGIALLRRQQRARPDLRLLVMSATVPPGPLARFLDAELIRVEGRAFPVEVEYRVDANRPLAARVAQAFRALTDANTDGHVLVFLPGAQEIRACEQSCRALAQAAGFSVHVLHGGGTRAAQDRAVRPSRTPKLILSTNVAETSVTIEGVAAVIDSGLARVATHDPWSGVSRLTVSAISQASAEQRAGRAGRTRPGRAIRLYSRHDHERRPAHDAPEIGRLDLSGMLLDLLAAGIEDVRAFEWFDPPPEGAIAAAFALLEELSATDSGRLTDTGRAMLRFPVHPRVARVLVEAERRGVADRTAGVAALLSERAIQSLGPAHERHAAQDADADAIVELGWLEQHRRDSGAALRLRLDPGTCRRVEQLRGQLGRLVRSTTPSPLTVNAIEEAIRRSLLTGFPDRVARVRDDGADRRTLVMCRGGSARQSPASVVRSAPWVIGLSVEERREEGRKGESWVRSVCAIEPEWLIEAFPDRVEDHTELRFDPERERVVGWSELRYGQLALTGSPLTRLPGHAWRLLADAALAAGPERFVADPGALAQLLLRTRFLHARDPRVPALESEDVRSTLHSMCEGRLGFDELRRDDLMARLVERLGESARRLDELAPTHVRLSGGRRLPVQYESDRDPWVASRLQDFFGARDGPSVLAGRLPLVVHLRAPNGRDVQVTTDLAGFWTRHYPELRRTLMRRYPKHDWPENPLRATPPSPAGLKPPNPRRRRSPGR